MSVSQQPRKVALVTGASSGIGFATAKRLIEDGLIVYVAARRLKKMSPLEELGAIPVKLDVTQEADIQAALKQIEREHAGVDVLVNNAGFGSYGSVEETSLENARYQFEVNLFGVARLTQMVIPYMRLRGDGKIINVSSIGGKIFTPLGAWYHATKHALEGWSDCLRLELTPFGIDVVVIEPGLIRTDFGEAMHENLTRHSLKGAYADVAGQMAEVAANMHKEGSGSPPEVVARTISKAIKARRPKTRYAMGKLARPLLFMRKYLSDRAFDKIVMSQVKGMQ